MNWTRVEAFGKKTLRRWSAVERRSRLVIDPGISAATAHTLDEDKLWPDPLAVLFLAASWRGESLIPGNSADEGSWPGDSAGAYFASTQESSAKRLATRPLRKPPFPKGMLANRFFRHRRSTRSGPPQSELPPDTDAGIDLGSSADVVFAHPLTTWLVSQVAPHPIDGQSERVAQSPIQIAQLLAALPAALGPGKERAAQYLLQILHGLSAATQRMQAHGARYALPRFRGSHCISSTGCIYGRLMPDEPQLEDRCSDSDQIGDISGAPLYQLVFSRATGDAFACVSRRGNRLVPRAFGACSAPGSSAIDGYLALDDAFWDPRDDYDLLPESCMKPSAEGTEPKRAYRPFFPVSLYFDELGFCSEVQAMKWSAWFMRAPLLFDPSGMFLM